MKRLFLALAVLMTLVTPARAALDVGDPAPNFTTAAALGGKGQERKQVSAGPSDRPHWRALAWAVNSFNAVRVFSTCRLGFRLW